MLAEALLAALCPRLTAELREEKTILLRKRLAAASAK
jgi:hypothetical protein